MCVCVCVRACACVCACACVNKLGCQGYHKIFSNELHNGSHTPEGGCVDKHVRIITMVTSSLPTKTNNSSLYGVIWHQLAGPILKGVGEEGQQGTELGLKLTKRSCHENMLKTWLTIYECECVSICVCLHENLHKHQSHVCHVMYMWFDVATLTGSGALSKMLFSNIIATCQGSEHTNKQCMYTSIRISCSS